MRKMTVLIIPEDGTATKQYKIPTFFIKAVTMVAFLSIGIVGYLGADYFQLLKIRTNYYNTLSENEGLKGEARLLIDNLENVKRALERVQNYSNKLNEITQLQVTKVSRKTGIGPLTPTEYDIAKKQANNSFKSNYMPLGINLDKLIFRPVFKKLDNIGEEASKNALELQRLLSNLSQQKSLLSSIPSIAPVTGWIASGFGPRISPFTGKKAWHMGIDIAALIGTPIYAPADGVVIFSGKKSGYGKFIMVAHGYGVVTRYGHNAQNMVQAGQRVKRGDQIATVGMTGRTTGPHLHYEVVVSGKNVNPRKFILNLSH